ncbi:GntR family transcriptional regulator [Intrasporangium chromatireducens Q5-1]|uniref:GntR family transcriptional regulator n=1 Tax=Intrasporangium chromatireducens Q5-1 TaxID=584657 RepID=W9GTL0_9MICO|nr:GntR family transcriptional regulator [Intrasporangium chromatireducens]EWT07219.1 GntR family transcriptional regulator [Intrasporangium chromatireducens Q5-1]
MAAPAPTLAYGSLAEQAYHVLRDRLVMLDIPPGAPINEGRLASDLGIGRTPIRESLKKLELDHLVVSFPRRGTFATQVDITDLAAISEMRQVLEPLAARRAALMARPQVRSELSAKAEQIASMGEEPEDKRPLMEYDIDVHRLIYRAAENPHLEETLVRLDNLATRIWCLVLDRLPSVSQHIREHVALLKAIVDRDADRAAELAEIHVTHFETTIRAVL